MAGPRAGGQAARTCWLVAGEVRKARHHRFQSPRADVVFALALALALALAFIILALLILLDAVAEALFLARV
jgi:hypothetical protein